MDWSSSIRAQFMPLRDVPRPAILLGLAGLIPFAGLAVTALAGPEAWRPWTLDRLAEYGATILAFMGGCRWGFAAAGLGEGPGWRLLTISVAPSLWAWGALAAGKPYDLALIAAGLTALFIADVMLAREGGAPVWWPSLRLPLTIGAVAGLLAGAAA